MNQQLKVDTKKMLKSKFTNSGSKPGSIRKTSDIPKVEQNSQLIPEGPAPRSDSELVAAFVGQECPDAFREIVVRYGPLVLSVCRKSLNKNEGVDDAFQETFLVLAKRADRIRSPEYLASWLYGVARRVSIDARRRSQKLAQRTVSLSSEIMSQYPDAPAPHLLPEESVEVALRKSVDQLPDKYRAPIVLCYFMGDTHVVAAQKLGVPEGSISQKLRTGQERLKKALKRMGFFVQPVAIAWLLCNLRVDAQVPPDLVSQTVDKASNAAGQTGLQAFAAKLIRFFPTQTKTLKLMSGLLIALLGLAGVESWLLNTNTSTDSSYQQSSTEHLPQSALTLTASVGNSGIRDAKKSDSQRANTAGSFLPAVVRQAQPVAGENCEIELPFLPKRD